MYIRGFAKAEPTALFTKAECPISPCIAVCEVVEILLESACAGFDAALMPACRGGYLLAYGPLRTGGRNDSHANVPAPQITIDYWKLRPPAFLRDFSVVVRADAAVQRDVNHQFAEELRVKVGLASGLIHLSRHEAHGQRLCTDM
jgi:hypothetical protein